MFNNSAWACQVPYSFWQACALGLIYSCEHNYFSLFYCVFFFNLEVSAFCAFRQNRLSLFVLKHCDKNMRLLFNYIRPSLPQRTENHTPCQTLCWAPHSQTVFCTIPLLYSLLQHVEVLWLSLHIKYVNCWLQASWNIFHFLYTSSCSKFPYSFFKFLFSLTYRLSSPDCFNWK